MKILVSLALLAALALSGCVSSSSGHLTAPPVSIAVTRITPTAPAILYYSGLTSSARLVIADQASLEAVWGRIFAGVVPPPPVPSVDFTRERVLVAALGQRPTGGFGIQLERADLDDSEVIVNVLSTSPGRLCVVSQAVTQPVDIVMIPAGQAPVRFEESSAIVDCTP